MRQHYELLHRQALDRIHSNGFEFDLLIDKPTDTRRGLTLLFRPESSVLNRNQEFINRIRHIAPDHYFYKNPDIHITVMPIISCYEGFVLEQVNPADYIPVIKSCISGVQSFDVAFRGVFFSTSCIIVKGYPLNGTLERIRENLRREFAKVPLEQSLDKRYVLRTAHSTVVRFKEPIQESDKMVELIASNAELEFGISTISRLSLVYNDWYQRHEHVTVLRDFLLK